jgi:cell division protein FtsZ
MPEIKPDIETIAKIKVVGVGGSGNAAINRMIASKIKGVEFIAVNTDVQALHHCQANQRLHIGKTTTRGLGAGMDPNLGRQSAEENQNEIRELLRGADMIFITCGLGGGTGTGAAPIVANLAKEIGALTVAVVTKPFSFEGAQRRGIAEKGLVELEDKVDAIVTIPNDRLLQVIDKKTSLLEAFSVCDEVLRQGVAGIAELITAPGLVNVDFADVKAIMEDTGSCLMGIGQGSGDQGVVEAAKAAISSPLLELSIEGAKGILFLVVGGPKLGMHEVNEAAKAITQSADPNAKIIFGAVIDESLKDEARVTVIATGFNKKVSSELERDIGEETPYRPSSFIRKGKLSELEKLQREPIVVEDEKDLPVSQPRVQMSSEKEGVAPLNKEEEEDLEVPAFIRKKIKK